MLLARGGCILLDVTISSLLLKVLQPVLEGRHLICESVDGLIEVGNWIVSLCVFGLVCQSDSPPLQGPGQDKDDDEGGDSAQREDVEEEVGIHGALLWGVN